MCSFGPQIKSLTILTDKTKDNVSKHRDKTSEENCVATVTNPSVILGKNGIRSCVLFDPFKYSQ